MRIPIYLLKTLVNNLIAELGVGDGVFNWEVRSWMNDYVILGAMSRFLPYCDSRRLGRDLQPQTTQNTSRSLGYLGITMAVVV